MRLKKLKEHIYLIDLETAGLTNFIASYVLRASKIAIIETGPTSSIPSLMSGLEELHIDPQDVTFVAVSHIHIDHGGGTGTLVKSLPNAKVIVHYRGSPHLVNPGKLWQQSKEVLRSIAELYGEPEPVPYDRIIPATDGMIFDLGNDVKLKVVETLGHASHHQSYYETLGEGVFSGDAAGMYLSEPDVVVPTIPSPFQLDSALASLDKLVCLKPRALYYSHFGEASDPARRLQTYAEQLNLWTRIAVEGVKNKESLESVRERILEADENLRRVQKLVEEHPVLSETVLTNSVQGVMGFAERHSGSQSSS